MTTALTASCLPMQEERAAGQGHRLLYQRAVVVATHAPLSLVLTVITPLKPEAPEHIGMSGCWRGVSESYRKQKTDPTRSGEHACISHCFYGLCMYAFSTFRI